jgi:hypothetical protein
VPLLQVSFRRTFFPVRAIAVGSGCFALSASVNAEVKSFPVHPAADTVEPQPSEAAPAPRDLKSEVPVTAYAYTAQGATARTIGIQAYGLGLAAPGQNAVAGGGGAIWASPVERLTVIADAHRSLAREFSPSVAAIARLYGNGLTGLTLGVLGKFKVEGFSAGPNRDEIESEAEAGGLLSYAMSSWHLDMNVIAGRGLGDDGETDAEGRLRCGRDVTDWLRVGVDSQARARLAGPKYLPNGRTWDFAAGAQAIVGADHYFGALTAGPTTMNLVTKDVGWTAMLLAGGTTF